MAEPFLDSQLVTCSINYHGHKLLKQLTAVYCDEMKQLELQGVDHKVYQARLPEISKQSLVLQETLRNFLCKKADRLYCKHVIIPCPEEQEEDYGVKDRLENLPSLDFYMKIPRKMRADFFYRSVKRGDLLHVRVVSHKELITLVRVMATLGNPPRDYSDVEIIAHLRAEDTRPHPDCTENGKWAIRTRLCVEVLTVVGSEKYMLVGTQGVTVGSERKDYSLGKYSKDASPPVFDLIASGNVATYSQALARLKTFSNPRSIKHMASKLGIDMGNYSSLMNSLRHKFPEREMYRHLRKAQVTRWAYKSVADGVSYFKKGQYEEAFQCLNKALQIDDGNVEAYVAKGALLANMGRFEKAIEEFEQALKVNAEHQNAKKYICETLIEYGKQLEEEGNVDKAEQMYNRCLEVNADHEAGKVTLHALNVKLGRVPVEVEEKPLIHDALKDLVNMELEFQRKCKDAIISKDSAKKEKPKAEEKIITAEKKGEESPNRLKVTKEQPVGKDEVKKNSPKEPKLSQNSLSPLSQKFAMQEGQWHPPPNIHTTASFLGPSVYGAHDAYGFHNIPPPPYNSGVPPPYPYSLSQPPPNIYQNQASTSSIVNNTEDEAYKARVDKFLKDIGLPGDGARRSKERGRKSHKKKKGRKDSHKRSKRRRRSRSTSGSRSSSSSSYSSSSSSSSSTSSSSDTGSSSSRSSSDKRSRSGRRSRSQRPNQKKKIRSKTSPEKVTKLPKDPIAVKKEVASRDEIEKMKDEAIPGMKSLEAKLSAYYEKVRACQEEPSTKEVQKKDTVSEEKGTEDSDSYTKMMETYKRYEKGFRLIPKLLKNTPSQVSDVHPVFKDSLSELQQATAVTDLKQKKEPDEKKAKPYPLLDNYMSKFVETVKVPKRVPSKSPAEDSIYSPPSRIESRSRSRSVSKSGRRRHSRSKSQEKGASRIRSKYRSRSRSKSRRRSRSRRPRHRSKSRSRSKPRHQTSSRTSRRSRSGSRSRLRNYKVVTAKSPKRRSSQGSHDHEISKSIEAAEKRINMQVKLGIAEKASNNGGNRSGKWDVPPKSMDKIRSRWDSPPKMVGEKKNKWDALSQIESFVAAAQQRKLEEIRERNKKFLRNSDD